MLFLNNAKPKGRAGWIIFLLWQSRRTRAGVWLSILLAFSVCAFALDPSLDVSQYAHSAWRISEGFTKGTIFSIAQTSDGYLWLGTEFGLLRFDGVRTTPWQPPTVSNSPAIGFRRFWLRATARFGLAQIRGLPAGRATS